MIFSISSHSRFAIQFGIITVLFFPSINFISSKLGAVEAKLSDNFFCLLDKIFIDKNFVLEVLDQLNKLKIQTWLTDVSGGWIMKKENFKLIIDKINIDE